MISRTNQEQFAGVKVQLEVGASFEHACHLLAKSSGVQGWFSGRAAPGSPACPQLERRTAQCHKTLAGGQPPSSNFGGVHSKHVQASKNDGSLILVVLPRRSNPRGYVFSLGTELCQNRVQTDWNAYGNYLGAWQSLQQTGIDQMDVAVSHFISEPPSSGPANLRCV